MRELAAWANDKHITFAEDASYFLPYVFHNQWNE